MKAVMIFLVLSLVVLMAEPGESAFGSIKAFWNGGRPGYKKYKYEQDMKNMAKKYGPGWKEGFGNTPEPSWD